MCTFLLRVAQGGPYSVDDGRDGKFRRSRVAFRRGHHASKLGKIRLKRANHAVERAMIGRAENLDGDGLCFGHAVLVRADEVIE
jgi:hypothetical protein